jgi:ribonucleoside-diphosphate reductase beta chain
MDHTAFATTTRGLDRSSVPMRLFEKAKRFGIWNPSTIDLQQDRRDWLRLADDERDLVLRLVALFQAGEEAVTRDIVPLIGAIADEGRIEEELFLTSFLWEEAKHTDFFSRFLHEVVQNRTDLSAYHSPSYRELIYHRLPTAMHRLTSDRSPAAQAAASVTYNVIVEGVLAETGYHAFSTMLASHGLMPGMCEAIRLLKQDESRHIAYGLYLVSRIVAAEPTLWPAIEHQLGELILLPMQIIDDVFSVYPTMPFGLAPEAFSEYAIDQFSRRVAWLERARDGTAGTIVPDDAEPA